MSTEPSRLVFADLRPLVDSFLNKSTVTVPRTIALRTSSNHPLSPRGFVVGPLLFTVPADASNIEVLDRADWSIIQLGYFRSGEWQAHESGHVAWVDPDRSLWPLTEEVFHGVMQGLAP